MANHGYMPGACLDTSEQTMYDPIKAWGQARWGLKYIPTSRQESRCTENPENDFVGFSCFGRLWH